MFKEGIYQMSKIRFAPIDLFFKDNRMGVLNRIPAFAL